MTVIEYIKSIKLKKAALLLESGKFTVSEVMYMAGFSNHSYFAKCFSARFGVHPSRYGQGSLPGYKKWAEKHHGWGSSPLCLIF